MKVIGLAGWSGAGKTTLLTRVIPHLARAGPARLRDQACPPRVRCRCARQGFLACIARRAPTEVLVSSAKRWALMHELRGAARAAAAGIAGEDVARSISS